VSNDNIIALFVMCFNLFFKMFYIVFYLKKYQIFFLDVFFYDFYILMLKIKKHSEKIILMHFELKNIFIKTSYIILLNTHYKSEMKVNNNDLKFKILYLIN
jgi:hypothetical protein